MTMYYTELCVGGPLNGKIISIPSNRVRFEVKQMKSLPSVTNTSIAQDVETYSYYRHSIPGDTKLYCIWVGEDVTINDAIEQILVSYKLVQRKNDTTENY